MFQSIWIKFKQLNSFLEISRKFQNPFLILLLRLGLIKSPYFPYRFKSSSGSYLILARPTTTSMADLFVLREVLLYESYRDLLPHLPKKPLRIVDVGANLGSFSIWLHRKIGLEKAFCFEPVPDSQNLLRFNLSHNECPGEVIPAAVGGTARTIQIALKSSSPGGTNMYHLTNQSAAVEVPVLAMEQWLKSTPGDFDLLKLDCECAEWEILERTTNEQLRRFPVVIAEVHAHPYDATKTPDDFRKLMEAAGFKTIRCDNTFHGLYLGVRQN
jgi:FkbM family methyltransferase